MKEQILNIIDQYPRTYKTVVKNNPELLDWVENNTLVDLDHLPTKIYSAVYQESNICPRGNQKKFVTFSRGFAGCGHASTCSCVSKSVSNKVSQSKSSYSAQTKKQITKKRQVTVQQKYGVKNVGQLPQAQKSRDRVYKNKNKVDQTQLLVFKT